jgi:hypothetical protein
MYCAFFLGRLFKIRWDKIVMGCGHHKYIPQITQLAEFIRAFYVTINFFTNPEYIARYNLWRGRCWSLWHCCY